MLKLLGDLKCYLKVQEVVTGSFVFRLHNSFTAAVLIACSLVITATQFVGKPIECIVEKKILKPVTTFCWITSTFTMPYGHGPYPGIASDDGDRKYHTYYQWVCFVLFFQAILCYMPKYIWEAYEGGLLSSMVNKLRVNMCKKDDDEEDKNKAMVMNYIQTHVKHHNKYAFTYFLCEFLCLVNVVGQLWIMNAFFQGEFLKYGLKVFAISEMEPEVRSDHLSYLFPKVTKCNFHLYGPSGTLQKLDALCILPLNIVNEKTYIFIWFWFMILLALMSLQLVYRVIILCCWSVRPRLLCLRSRAIPPHAAEAICRKISVGDWWLLYMICRNTDSMVFRDLIKDLSKNIETHDSNLRCI